MQKNYSIIMKTYKLNYFSLLIILFSITTYSQVGIGTTTPNAALDITSANDGLLIPRVALTATNVAAPLTAPSNTELVFNTNTAGAGLTQVTPGLYYWSTTLGQWVRVAPNAWDLNGNSGTNAATNFIGTTDNTSFVGKTNNTERFRILNTGNTGFGTTTPSSLFSIGGTTSIGSTYATSNVAPTNGLRIEGHTVIGKPSGEDSRDYFSVHTTTTAFSNITGYPSSAGARAIAGYAAGAGSMGILGYSTSTGFGVVGLTQPGSISAFVQTGEGVLGQADGQSTGIPIGVHGIIDETVAGDIDATPVLGENNNITTGTGFQGGAYASNKAIAGVYGNIGSRVTLAGTNGYMFGVVGDILTLGGGTIPDGSGGILGSGGSGNFGMLGYRGLTGTLYSVYGGGFSSSIAAGNTGNKNENNVPNNHIGIGINGGFMGGFIKGNQYGIMSKGEEFGMYVQGNTLTNQPIVILSDNNSNKRTISYGSSSTDVDITTRGTANLNNGEAYISFKESFKNLVSETETINITVTPNGETNGLYISRITKDGFYVKENKNGKNSVTLNWIAIGTKKGYENGIAISKEILDSNFEKNITEVLENDETGKEEKSMFFDGQKVQFQRIPEQFIKNAKKETPSKK